MHEAGFIGVLEDCFSFLGNRHSEKGIKNCQVSVNRHGFILLFIFNYL